MGQKIKISYLQSFKGQYKNCYGVSTADENTIEINLSYHNTEKQLLGTLYHEVLHIITNKSGIYDLAGHELDEIIIKKLEEFLFPLINFNKRKWRKKIEVELKSEEKNE